MTTTNSNNLGEDKYKHTIFYLLALAIIVAIAYWPISFHILSLKNDALNYFLPVRHLVSESFQHNILPTWTPYLNLGYPLHGDMQSGVWNPVVQFLSLFGTYSLYTLQIETLIYIYLGGVGMFFLLRHFRVHPYANIIAATGYMLCGFNSDSAQFLNWIAGTAFLPFVFLFYYRAIFERSIWNSAYAAVAMFFLFTCAYPADFILTAYILLAMFLVAGIRTIREKKMFELRHLILAHLLMLIVFILLCGPAILSYVESLPLQERGNGADYAQVMSNPLHPLLLSTFTTPLGAWKMPGVEETDPLIRNSYIGIAAFLLAIVSFLTRSSRLIVRFSKWAALFFLLFSLGEFGGLRILSYYTLPLMDAFRHPANAKLFTLFFLCLLSGFTLNSIIRNEIANNKVVMGFRIVAGIVTIVLIVSLFTPLTFFNANTLSGLFSPANGKSFALHLKENLEKISFADIIIVTSIIQAVFLWLIYKYFIRRRKMKWVVILAVINSILFTMLFQPFTVVKKARASFTQSVIDANTIDGYPIPFLDSSLSQNSTGNEDLMGEMGCRNLYNKKIGRSEYRITPCNLLTQNEFWFNPKLRDVVMNYPLLYRADTIVPLSQLELIDSFSRKRIAFVETDNSLPIKENRDSTVIHFTKFSPGYFSGEIESDMEGMYVLLQNNYPRWKLFIDGKPASILRTNATFMGFRVSAGKHSFVFEYQSRDLKIALLISYLALAFLVIVGIVRQVKSRKPIP
jgi:hypothetical protein